MSDHIKNFIDKIADGKSAEAGDAFKDALRDKVATALDNTRKDIASQMFTADTLAGVTASYSQPKPEIIDPAPTTVPADLNDVPGNEGSVEQN
jgi:hypothetical protein